MHVERKLKLPKQKRPSFQGESDGLTTSARGKCLGKHWARVYQPCQDVSMFFVTIFEMSDKFVGIAEAWGCSRR